VVSLAAPDLTLVTLRFDQLTKSVDLALRDLLSAGSDPVALACYLWVCRRHNLQLVNSAALASWGSSWVKSILIEQGWGRKRDDDISSALLVASVMQDVPTLRGLLDVMKASTATSLAPELERHALPFNHPGPAAMSLLGAVDLGLDDVRLPTATKETLSSLEQTMSAGRVFGIAFAILAFKKTHQEGDLSALAVRIVEALDDPETDYEDRIYLSQGLYYLADHGDASQDVSRSADMIVAESPVWSYLLNGQEDVAPAGDGRAIVTVSHLCRAALLDLLIHYRKSVAEHMKAQIDSRYQETQFTGLSAFGFYALILALVWIFLGRILLRDAGSARQFFLLDNYDAMSAGTAWRYVFVVFAALLTFPLTPGLLLTCWEVVVRKSVAGGKSIRDVLWRRSRAIVYAWLTLLVAAFAINVVTTVSGGGFKHLVSGK
jgi:hypothetical protein